MNFNMFYKYRRDVITQQKQRIQPNTEKCPPRGRPPGALLQTAQLERRQDSFFYSGVFVIFTETSDHKGETLRLK